MNVSAAGEVTGNPAMITEDSVEKPNLHIRHHEHHKAITMADIAKAAGVSQGAISSLLNDRDYGIRVSDKTRERVFKVCREMGYVPNDLRAVVRMYPERGELCLLASREIPSVVTDPFYSRVLRGAMDAVSEQSHAISVAQYDATLDYNHAEFDAMPHPMSCGTASKYLCVGTPSPSLCQAIVRRGFSVGCIGHEILMPGVTSIMPDYAEASRVAIEHLFKLGHKHIAIFSGPFGSTEHNVIELNRGVRIGYEKMGVLIEAQNIVYGDLTFKNGYNSLDVLLSRTPQPTAILCLNDSAASGVLARAQNKGIKVPDDLSVLGCSDDLYSECVHPKLSTIHLPAEEMGATGAQETERRVRDKEHGLSDPKKIVLPVRLIERESCAAPREKSIPLS
jgi:LacI family repressor for deo operon, udp, cdd, tsx, nupC, and nupG